MLLWSARHRAVSALLPVSALFHLVAVRYSAPPTIAVHVNAFMLRNNLEASKMLRSDLIRKIQIRNSFQASLGRLSITIRVRFSKHT